MNVVAVRGSVHASDEPEPFNFAVPDDAAPPAMIFTFGPQGLQRLPTSRASSALCRLKVIRS